MSFYYSDNGNLSYQQNDRKEMGKSISKRLECKMFDKLENKY